MTIDVRGPDGTIYRVNTDDEEVARATVRRQLAQSPQQPQAPQSAAGDVVGSMMGRSPSPGYRAAYAREQGIRDPEVRRQRVGGPRIPVLDDFSAFSDQMAASTGLADDAASLRARIGQGAENLIRGVRGQPVQITPDEAARAAYDEQNHRTARYAQQHPNLNTAAGVTEGVGLLGNPANVAGPISAVRSGLASAGIDAPFAFGRQEGDFEQRLPGAAQEIGTAGAFGTVLQGVANRLIAPRVTRAPRPGQPPPQPRSWERAQDFANAGVDPTLAATNQGAAAGATKLIGENFIAGVGVRSRLNRSIRQTAERVRGLQRRIAGGGEAQGRLQAGEGVQTALRRFARDGDMPSPRPGDNPRHIRVRDWSFPAKARAVYDDVFGRLADEEQRMIGQVEGRIVTTDATERTLQDILRDRVSGLHSRRAMANPRLQEIEAAILADQRTGQLRFQDLRQWRSAVREMRRDPGLRGNVADADLARLEGALSNDIYESASLIGGQAAADLRSADRWYARVTQRIRGALDPFVPKGDYVGGGERAFRRIVEIGSQGGSENARQLSMLRSALRDDEWRVVSSSIVEELGHPMPGSPDALEPDAFSIARFGTRFARLSDEAKTIFFGPNRPGTLRAELETLARVAKYQEGVERMANNSRSGVAMQNFATGGAMLNPSLWGPTVATLTGMAAMGEIMTHPAFVRWLNSVSRSGGAGGMRRQLAALAQLAARDPALAPFYNELTQRVAGQSHAPQAQQPAQPVAIQ